jgi:hypothetical protein
MTLHDGQHEETEAAILLPGTLVRYVETTNRWVFALVRRATTEVVKIRTFLGDRLSVNPEQVEPFSKFMRARSRSFTRERTALCRLFYGEDLLRLHKGKLREMQRVLRKHGYSFEPQEWPAPDTAVTIRSGSGLYRDAHRPADSEFAALLPRWLEPYRMPPASRDPLGLQSYAEKLADSLLPDLTVATARIGYYGFLCWAIDLVNRTERPRGTSRQELLNRLERAFVLCEFASHDESDRCPVLGQRSRVQVLASAESGRYRVPARILKNQNTAGALRLYVNSMEGMGFLAARSENAVAGKLPWDLTDLGRRLENAFRRRLPDRFADFALSDAAKPYEDIRLWGGQMCFSRLRDLKTYRDCFLDGLLFGNSPEAGILRQAQK